MSVDGACGAGSSWGASRVSGGLWGKGPERLAAGLEPYPLVTHQMDTFGVASALWDVWLAPHLRRLLIAELGGGGDLGGGDAGEFVKRWACFAAGAHDVGKASPGFQVQVASPRSAGAAWRLVMADRLTSAGLPLCDENTCRSLAGPGKTARRHEFVGMVALTQLLRPAGEDRAGVDDVHRLPLAKHWVAAVAGGHHGRWHPCGVVDDAMNLMPVLLSPAWAAGQREILDTLLAAAGLRGCDIPVPVAARAGVVITLLTGFTILADWIASSDTVVQAGYDRIDAGADPWSPDWAGLRAEELRGVVERTVGSYVPFPDAQASILGWNSDGTRRRPRPLQRDAEQVGAGAWFVAYPTGEGKTDAALLRHAAGEGEGLIFGLPTRATTDEMQRRLSACLAPTGNTVLLSHQFAAAHHVECASSYGLEWFSSSIRRLVAPVVAATCDQILSGSLKLRHSPLRLLALANHHVVLDEVHTYDQYQSFLLKNLLEWWGATGTRVTLLSATLPAWQQRDFASAYSGGSGEESRTAVYPAHWTVTSESGPVVTPDLSTRVPDLGCDLVRSDEATKTHIRWALEQHDAHPRCHAAIVRSTVGDTIDTARSVREALRGDGSVEVVCLHSRMTVRHRAGIQERLEQRLGPRGGPGPALMVVASQVLEAGLDYDFDLMSSDLVPAAALIQRAGRLWRFADPDARRARFGDVPDRRVVHVVARTRDGQIDHRSALPYFAAELDRVAGWLEDKDVIRIPEHVQDFVDETSMDLQTVEATADTADEIATNAVMIQQAMRAVSCLAQRVARPTRRTRYDDLVDLTGGDNSLGPQDEDRMGTRFQDRETLTLVLLDGDFGAGTTRDELSMTRDAPLIQAALGAMLPVSDPGMIRSLRAVAGQHPWAPAARLLASCSPFTTADLDEAGLRYDPDFGLVHHPPSFSPPGDARV